MAVFAGKTFTVLQGKYQHHEYFKRNSDTNSSQINEADFLKTGRIHHIVVTIADPYELYFAFYDPTLHRRPPAAMKEWHYAKCKDFIGSKNKMIQWDSNTLVGEALIGKDVCMYFKNRLFYTGTVEQFTRAEKETPYTVLFKDGERHKYSEKTIVECLRIYH